MYRYSQRLRWHSSLNSLALQLQKRRALSQPVVDLTISNPTEVFEKYPHSQISRALGEISNLRYVPDPRGSYAARVAISEYYESRNLPICPDQLQLTASTSEAYALLFKLFCDPGQEILVPSPSYPLFTFLAHLESVRVEEYRLGFDGTWHIDLDHLRSRVNSLTRAIVIVNPNNPTGSFLKKDEFVRVAALAEENAIPIICDEVFQDYAFRDDDTQVKSLIGADGFLSCSLNGLSKCAGMPQMKLGWIAVNGPASERASTLERLELIADTYLSVSTPVQNALPQLFEIGASIQSEIKQRTRANLALLQSNFNESAARELPCESGWSAIIRLPATRSEEEWTLRLLDEYGILVQPGYFFDMPQEPYIVASLITKPDDFKSGVDRIREFAQQ